MRTTPEDEGWTVVTKKKEMKKKKKKSNNSNPAGNNQAKSSQKNEGGKGKIENAKSGKKLPEPETKKKKGKIRVPKSAAVIITPNPEKGVTRTEVLQEARSKIKLEELGISHLRPRIAAIGAVIIEVPGESSHDKADKLADKLRTVISESKARITRPVKRMRIMGLDESVTKEELALAIEGL